MNPYALALRDIVSMSTSDLLALPAELLLAKPEPSKWSMQEIIGHLIDSAYNNYQRFLRAPAQDDLVFPGYAQDEWVRRAGYQNREPTEIIQGWQTTNLHLAALLDSLSQEEMQRVKPHNFHQIGMYPIAKQTSASLEFLIWDYLYHLEHHLGQILPHYDKRALPSPIGG